MLCSVDSYGWYVCYICSGSYQRVGSVMVYLSADVYVYVVMLCMYDGVVCSMCSSSASVRRACSDVHICISMAGSSSCMCMRMCSRQYVVAVMPSAVYACGLCAVLYGWHVLCVQW